MEDHFYDNDFERFLQQQVKHHRMYPSDAVWKGIYKQVHGYKRWPGLYFFAILMIAALTVCTLFIESEPILPLRQTIAKATTLQYDQLNPAEITEHTMRNVIHDIDGNQQPDLPLTAIDPVLNEEQFTNPGEIAFVSTARTLADPAIPAFISTPASITSTGINLQETGLSGNIMGSHITVDKKSTSIITGTKEEEEVVKKSTNPTDEYLEQHPDDVAVNLQQQIRNKPSRWQLQFYIAPSMNYRVIVDEKDGAVEQGPVSTNYGVNASKVIRYNPGMGIEMGFGAAYSLTNKLKVKAALQYNIRQYNIEAYAGSTELAKIAMIRGGNVDTFLAISRYRSTGVYGEAQLLNKYHQVSLPVGLEYTLFASKRFGFNLGGTLQPTYTFSESSYLLSSDYKSYADGKSIIRRWNLNSSLEAVFTYNARNVQWRLGPQLRYQHLPNYSDAYPIKEYLIDYGFKIGFTKTIQ